jgi:hypothetical protein
LVERRYTPAGKKSYEAYFSEKGRVRSRVQSAWEGERLLQTEARGEDDTLVHVGVCEGDLVGYCFFRPDGQVQATGAFHQASPTGLWSFFDEAGRLAHQIDLGPLKLKGHQVDEDFDPDWLLGQALLPQASTGPRPLQLDGVEKVDWKNVHGCWSEKVKAFPALLQAMTSPERAVRHVAFGEIQGECEHQGSTYEATARVVPFLVRLLEHENADRKDILDFIYQVGCASSGYVEQVQELEEDDVERIAIEGTYQAVRAGWPSFARLLDDPDPVLRERAILLAAFADRDRVKDAIARAAEHDPEVRLRGVAIQTLLALDGAEPAEALPFLDHPDPVLRLVTATCACKRFGPDAPARSVDVLRECFEQWETLRGRYEELPFVNEHMLADLSIAVGSIRNDQARAMGPALAASLDTVDAFSSIRYARGLFALCFGNGDKPYAACFPEILATVARSQRFFEYVNCNEVLDAWNLPHSAEQLRALAELVAAAPDPEEAMYQKMHEGGEVEGGCDNEEEDDG